MIDKSDKLVFVGYAPGGYRLLNVENRKIHLSCNVRFNELSFTHHGGNVNVNDDLLTDVSSNIN